MSLFSGKFNTVLETQLNRLGIDTNRNMESSNALIDVYCPHVGLNGSLLFPDDKGVKNDSQCITTSLCTKSPPSPILEEVDKSNGQVKNNCQDGTTMSTANGMDINEGGDVEVKINRIGEKNEFVKKCVSQENSPNEMIHVNGDIGHGLVNGDIGNGTSDSSPHSGGDMSLEFDYEEIPVQKFSVENASQFHHIDTKQPKRKTRKRLHCSACDAKINLWKCMSIDCGLIFCGGSACDHARLHFLDNPDHSIQQNLRSQRLWCNLCDREVFQDYRNRRPVPGIWFLRDNPEDCPPRGLFNIGNTCYMNAALQNIAAVAPLTSYFMGDTFHDDETKTRRISGSYRMLLDELFSHKNSTYLSAAMPSRLLHAVRLVHPIFRGFHQNDVQEFLRFFMDSLSAETKIPHFDLEESTKCEQGDQEGDRDSDAESFATADSGHGTEEAMSTNGMKSDGSEYIESNGRQSSPVQVKVTMKSIVDDVFNGQIESSVQCLYCHETSRRLEVFQDLSLPIPTRDELSALRERNDNFDEDDEEPVGWFQWFWDLFKWYVWGPAPNLYDCLGAFFSSDELKGKNMYSCEKCKNLRNGVKRCSLYRLPEVLSVHLKRFRVLETAPHSNPLKINQTVKFPLDDLDLRSFLHSGCPDQVSTYGLIGVICHHGSTGMGHYTAYIRKNETWFVTDDCRVAEVSVQEVENCEAYVLFYQKCDVGDDEYDARCELLRKWKECDDGSQADIKFHLISRKWLTQYLWGEEGISLDNTDVVCPHGKLVPVDNLDMNATWIPDIVWNAIVNRCGGGPDIKVNEVCQICAVAWKKYQRTALKKQRCSTSRASRTLSFNTEGNEAYHLRSQYDTTNLLRYRGISETHDTGSVLESDW